MLKKKLRKKSNKQRKVRMDNQLRELECKANTGDYEAANQLHRLRVRAGAEDVANLPAIWMKYWIQNKDLP